MYKHIQYKKLRNIERTAGFERGGVWRAVKFKVWFTSHRPYVYSVYMDYGQALACRQNELQGCKIRRNDIAYSSNRRLTTKKLGWE
jgi:hypothetical protein